MNRQVRRPLLGFFVAVTLGGGAALATAPPILAADQLGQITEFSTPTGGSFPTRIITGGNGNLWFTENRTNQIAEVTTNGIFTEFALPNPNSQPLDVALGSDGNIWFTEANGNRIGKITTGGAVTEFAVPTAGSVPDAITAGPDGNLWFTEELANKVARITPAGVITEFPVPTPGSPIGANGIGAGPDGNVWFTEHSANQIGRITPSGGITEFLVPTAGSGPTNINPGPDGNMWFTEFDGNRIGRITTTGTTTGEFPVPTAGTDPTDLRAGPDGNMWFTEFNVNQVARITMTGNVTEFKVPTPSSGPGTGEGGIAAGPDGNMWFTEDSASKIARIGTQPVFPGPSLFAAETRSDTIDVGDDTNSVLATTSFANQPGCSAGTRSPEQAGCRAWRFGMVNQGASTLTGAQVSVDSSSSGLALTDRSEFNFTFSNIAPGPGIPPQSTPCPAPSLHQEMCPVPGSTLSANGGSLDVSSSLDPQSGVPIAGLTTGYDSARLVSPPTNGIATATVPITLRDSTRFGGQGVSNDIGIVTFNSNVVPGSATITSSSGLVAACPPPGMPPTNTACADPPSYQACTNTRCGPGQVCTSAFAHIRSAVLNQTYSLNFQEYVANTNNPATGNCGSVKPALRIDVSPMTLPSGPTSCCATILNDPTLGTVTFSVDAGQSTVMQAQLRSDYVIQYSPEPQLQVMIQPTHLTEGQSVNGPVAIFFEQGDSSPLANDYTASIDWGDGSSSSGVVSGPDAHGIFVVSGAHTYLDEAGRTLSLSVTDLDTPWNTGTGSGPARVEDAPLSAPTGQIFGAVSPVTNARVAIFHDANPSATCADFNGTDQGPTGLTPGSITVLWDGTVSTTGNCSPGGSGNFTVTTSNPSAELGPHSIAVKIVDDGGQTATVTNTVFVGAFPSNGSFVVGDQNDTGTVTFWGAMWSLANLMSGGPAPGQFKGFEDGLVHPTVCSGTWTGGPGNSSGPPATIPRWMALIVASSVTSTNNLISGDVHGIVIVDTSGSGYSPNPGGAGTATLVATVCGP